MTREGAGSPREGSSVMRIIAGRPARPDAGSTLTLTRRAAVWGPPVAVAAAGWVHRWNAEDSFINFRVVAQLLDGNGPVFNAGERVEAATSPLWLGILTLGAALTGSIEWFAVVAGLVGTVAGVALAGVAATRLAGPVDVAAWVPFGSVLFVALPPVWQFATSGLETGLTFAWLGGSFLALVSRLDAGATSRSREVGIAVLLGLGPLIRPDLALISAGFLAALLLVSRDHRGLTRVLATAAAALALPVAYQVFRMGYYAALVPTTAIAKEASSSRWDQGFRYLGDFVAPYLLWLPLAAVLGVLVWTVRGWGIGSPRSYVALSPVVAGLLHVAFVVRVGGDFMHGRLLLPGLFAVLLPVAVVPLRRAEPATGIAVATVAVWGLVAALSLRTDYHDTMVIPPENGGIADEHGYYVAYSGTAHPVTLEDYRTTPLFTMAQQIRRSLERGHSYVNANVFLTGEETDVAPSTDLDQPIVTLVNNVGILGYTVGPDVWVVDMLGLGDPFAARTALPEGRPGRIGHEKSLHPAWVLARFADAPPLTDPGVAAATRALTCGDVEELQSAVSAPLTARRFWANLVASPRLTALRLDPLPTDVPDDQCRAAERS